MPVSPWLESPVFCARQPVHFIGFSQKSLVLSFGGVAFRTVLRCVGMAWSFNRISKECLGGTPPGKAATPLHIGPGAKTFSPHVEGGRITPADAERIKVVHYDSVTTIIRNLNQAAVRYLVVGGLAVVAHGYVRFTADVDLLIGLESENVQNAMGVLKALEYTPRAPVPIEAFADPAKRRLWIREKAMTVFSLYSALYPDTEIDIFVEDPLGFDQAVKNAENFEIAEGVFAPVCSLTDLIKLKAMAGRPQDLLDIQKLKLLRQEPQ